MLCMYEHSRQYSREPSGRVHAYCLLVKFPTTPAWDGEHTTSLAQIICADVSLNVYLGAWERKYI